MKYVNLKNYIDVLESGKREKGGALNSGIPSLGAEHLNSNGGFILNNEKLKYISENYFNSLKTGIIKKNDILIVKDGATTGKISYIDENFPFKKSAINEHIFIIRPTKDFFTKYLFYFLYSPIGNNKILEKFHGATVGGISKNFVDMTIPLPPIEEQHHIAEVLDKVTAQIDNCNKILQNLDLLVKSKFVQMFGDPVSNPMGWEIFELKDIAILNKGITYSPENVIDNGIIVLRSSNIKGNKFDLNDLVTINKIINSDKLVQENDILMCNRNGSANLVGKVAKIPKLDVKMTFGTFMTIIRSNYYEYLFNFFQTKAFRNQIKFQTSVAINQISLPLLESVKVPIPPIELQNQFAEFVENVEKQKTTTQNTLNQLETLKNALMQEYFS